MSFKVDRKKIAKEIKALQERDKRGRVTLYLNLGLYKEFQEACEKEDVPASMAVGRLMESFLGR